METHSIWWALGLAIVLIPLAAWSGLRFGRRAARKYPGMAAALWVISTFLKIDPPPPPKAEQVIKDQESAGDPPSV